ncbi:pentatricopeptide repeat-containing protein CRR2, chloroplastic [Cryptomeria japonica]|uniref:pentatricopeptide repeat-containing protein CRR2, chloroplastic n=1 Tax=Cryptomeria japonica TaxID=3369 RepID=UPI0027D9E6AD|nr:pentatricopeptide repeat-containing protein CRR2, chloroplastic [Cryptomeria japonica]
MTPPCMALTQSQSLPLCLPQSIPLSIQCHNNNACSHVTLFNSIPSPCVTRVATKSIPASPTTKHLNSTLVEISTLCKQGRLKEAFDILFLCCENGSPPWEIYGYLLQACTRKRALTEGKQIHAQLVIRGSQGLKLETKLISMYAACGSVGDAELVFERIPRSDINVFLWTALISGYVQNEFYEEGLAIYCKMRREGTAPDNFTFSCVLKACSGISDLQLGKVIHVHLLKSGLQPDAAVQNSLVVMYARYGKLEIARQLFDEMSCGKNVISWGSMIAGCVQNQCVNEALELFREMQIRCLKTNWVIVTTLLPACSYLAAIKQGKEIHSQIVKADLVSDVMVWNALIDMYAKCGNVDDARQVFDRMPERDVVSWNAVIGGCGTNGCGEVALGLFKEMQQEGFVPNHITLIHVLSACSHAGLVEEGLQIFNSMSETFDIRPRVEHYACMVDLLGRAGFLDEAEQFINKMPKEIKPSSSVWGSLLAACRVHGNVELATRVAKHALEIDPENNGYYIILSNIYAAGGRWDDVKKVRKMMKDRGFKKSPGCSWIEMNNRVYTFTAGDQSLPQSKEIYAMVEKLSIQMKEAGYVPETNFVLYNVQEKEKEMMLCGHSEKLAISFVLINTHTCTRPIRVIKNLRICGDCHTVIKFISKIVRREIIVRDTNRFHHFKGGVCSCRDYW